MGFFKFVGFKSLGIVLAFLTFVLFILAMYSPIMGSVMLSIIAWIITIFCGVSSWYCLKHPT